MHNFFKKKVSIRQTIKKIKLRLYLAFEIKSLFREYGFRNIEIYGDLDTSPYDNKAKRVYDNEARRLIVIRI
ncbi:MAG: hypothetical protein ACPLN1_06450 [Caldisericia bacterium]